MNNIEKDAFLHNLYYDKHMVLGRDLLFYYVSKTLKNTEISRRYIANWLAHQESNQIFAQKKKETSIRPILTNKPGSVIQIDLMDFSNNPSFGNYKYILNFIDTFTRKLYLTPLKNKSVKTVDKALEKNILDFQKYYPISVIQSDNGGEFAGDVFAKYNIKHITSRPYTPQQNGIVERSNGTIKSILKKVLFNENVKDWKRFIPEIQDIYNTTLNTTIGKSPDELFNDTSLHKEISDNVKVKHARSFKEINTLLSIGNKVRIYLERKSAFDKTQNYSNEIYTVSKVIKGNAKNFTIPRYKLKDSEGNVQKNTFALSKLLVIP